MSTVDLSALKPHCVDTLRQLLEADQYRPLSRRLDRCDRVIQNESGDSIGGNV